jgi:hypothetical protein
MERIASQSVCSVNTPAPITAVMLLVLESFAMIGIGSVQNRVSTPGHDGCSYCIVKPAN